MANYFEKKERHRKELEKYYKEKSNLRLKYMAVSSAIVSIILMLIMAFGVVDNSNTTLFLLMRGFAGIFTIIFVVLVAVIVYRVNVSYFRDKIAKREI